MIIFLYGSDTFRSLQKLKQLKEKFLKDVAGGSLNLIEIDGEKLSFAEFKKEVTTISFLAEKRLIIIKNIICKGKNRDIQKEIIEYLKERKNDENVLVFWEEEKREKDLLFKLLLQLDKKERIANPVKREIFKQEFEPLKGANLKEWIISSAKEKGGAISSGNADFLIEKIGNDLWQLNNELDKLISFSKKISSDDIKKIVIAQNDESIFELTDAIGGRNKRRALELLNNQIQNGTNVNYILAMLARQYRILMEIKDYIAKNENKTEDNLARGLNLHPYVVKKLASQIKLYEMATLKKIYKKVSECDLKIKTSRINPELLLDLIILDS